MDSIPTKKVFDSGVAVSQFDKVNAITNKPTNSIILNDLTAEDQMYLNNLEYSGSSNDEAEDDISRPGSSVWSPMLMSPVMVGSKKRIKRMKSSNSITLSLEELSYIRPSWGLSKTVQPFRKKDKDSTSNEEEPEDKRKEKKSNESICYYFVLLITIIIIIMTIPKYIIHRREEKEIHSNKIKVNIVSKTAEFFKPNDENLKAPLKLLFGRDVPNNLKPDKCTCDLFSNVSKRMKDQYNDQDDERSKVCLACLDWAARANLRIYVRNQNRINANDRVTCYDIKWQSYDTLKTPLVDCFMVNDGQWFGLGDLDSPNWPLNRQPFDWTPVQSNLSREFLHQSDPIRRNASQLAFGSYAKLSLFVSNGFFIGNLKTDFHPSVSLTKDSKTNQSRVCVSVSCTDKCTQSWLRGDRLDMFRFKNNIFEYSLCSSDTIRPLISRQIQEKIRAHVIVLSEQPDEFPIDTNRNSSSSQISERLIKKESLADSSLLVPMSVEQMKISPTIKRVNEHGLPAGIGLLDRVIFATSPDFMQDLDGQSLRDYVENIFKLSLKLSSILIIDSRWQTHIGSIKLNTTLFPKSKSLFEVLHNRGFKIVFTVKPYIDFGIGIGPINELFESGKLYSVSYNRDTWDTEKANLLNKETDTTRDKQTIVRRESLFGLRNETIQLGFNKTLKFPYLCKCRESPGGYCVLLDLTLQSNRAWLIDRIKRSNILTVEADGIKLGGSHSNNFDWDDHFRDGMSELVRSLFYSEKLFTLPQWTGDFGYIELAPRKRDWDSLRSMVNSVLNLGMMGYSLINPGSVWGDVKNKNQSQTIANHSHVSSAGQTGSGSVTFANETEPKVNEKLDEELIIRWLQVAIFLPILQFNDFSPIERNGLREHLQNLVRLRKLFIIPELKRNLPLTPLINQPKMQISQVTNSYLPLVRPVWFNHEKDETIVNEQFLIGTDILVAPILSEGVRQREIYLPNGFWHDKLRQVDIKGARWLRNYTVELNEIAWFTRIRR